MNELQERLNELEIRFTHQAMLLEELNDVVAESARRIDLLERDNRQVREMLRGLAPALSESPDE
ncbi:MAG: SlyX family protein [Trichloromonadaceae bacterium]